MSAAKHEIEQCLIPAGTFTMGDSSNSGFADDGELPRHEVQLDAFSIDATTVTNYDFAAFIYDSGYQTEAERLGSSAVFHLAVAPDDPNSLGAVAGAPWWISVRGASWKHPFGPHSTVEKLADHPV